MYISKHILIVLSFMCSVMIADDCPDGMIFMDQYLNAEDICVPEDFSNTNQSSLQAFYIIGNVTVNGNIIDTEDWVAAYKDDICVGSRLWGICGDGSTACDVPAMGFDGNSFTQGYMYQGDSATFKIFDVSENTYLDATPSENQSWTTNGILQIESLSSDNSVFGCTNTLACNYNPSANVEDGSCEFAEENYDCDENCAVNIDACGVCNGDNSTCSGCVDSYALNFDELALVSDGSCLYPVYGCMDILALNYNADATNPNGECDYYPEVGLSFGNIDSENGTIEVMLSTDKQLDQISFSLSGATINSVSDGLSDELSVTADGSNISSTGIIESGTNLLAILSFIDGGNEFCFTSSFASAPGYESTNITIGGCSVFVGSNGGEIISDDAGVEIPPGALSESENISIGEVTEDLPEEVDNATGFDVEEIVAFTPFDIVFEVPVEITITSSSDREDEYLCYLEDTNDIEWSVVDGASCSNGTCTADVNSFGIFATCILVEDCNGDLGGFAYLDDCGDCVGGNTGNENNYNMDVCGLCYGPGLIDWYVDSDNDNLGFGSGVPFCSDIVPDGYVPNNADTEPNCATNDTDECGLCGGPGIESGFDCDGNCIAPGGYDCNNQCGGFAQNDDCGICGGDNSSCTDCNGDINGSAYIDGCDECVGGDTNQVPCPTDCNGIDGGSAWINDCGECVEEGDISCIQGCDGNWSNDGSELINDLCGVCNGDNSSCSGCTDSLACNFSPDAIIEDDSCEYSETNYDCLGNCTIEVDCLGQCGGISEEDECGACNGPGPSVWYGDSDNDGLGDPEVIQDSCNSPFGYVPNNNDAEPDCGTNDTDDCGVCGGPGSGEEYDCEGNCVTEIDCEGECGGSAIIDECGICSGDGISEDACDCDGNILDCFGACGGSAVEDNCGICYADGSENPNWNSSCWFIDIAARVSNEPLAQTCIGASYNNQEECENNGGLWTLDLFVCLDHPEYDNEEDCLNNVGENAWINQVNDPLYSEDLDNRIGMHEYAENGYNDCGELTSCVFNDFQDFSSQSFNDSIALYIPYAGDSLWDNPFFDNFDYRFARDIRALENLNSFDDLRIWDIVVESEIPESYITLEFDIVNETVFRELNGFNGYTRLFVFHNGEFHEKNNNGLYEFPYSGSEESIQVVIGYGIDLPSVSIVEPIQGEIFEVQKHITVDLAYEESYFIDSLYLYIALGDVRKNIYSGTPVSSVDILGTDFEIWNWINEQIDNNDFISDFSFQAEIVDLANYNKEDFLDYYSEVGLLTFSQNSITQNFEATGWHLLAPPLSTTDIHDLENMFFNPTWDCFDGCSIIDGANSGEAFYVDHNGSLPSFTFTGDVLEEAALNLQKGWNLLGNPLVTPIDIHSLIITYNNSDYSWSEATNGGIISPNPIVFDNSIGTHVGTELLSTAKGFWIHSFYNDVTMSFIPSNETSEIEESLYWDLSLFAKENNTGSNYDDAIGSEIVIGIHEDAKDAFVDGEDQEAFPIEGIDIFQSFTEISVSNEDLSSIYKDIRSYNETSITWDISVETSQPYNSEEGILLTWDIRGNIQSYEYFLNKGSGTLINMKEQSYVVAYQSDFINGMSITAQLKSEYIGCTNDAADNSNEIAGDIDDEVSCYQVGGEWTFMDYGIYQCSCFEGQCLGGNQAENCNILALSMPVNTSIDPSLADQSFSIPISLVNPQNIEIEGLQFTLEYNADMIQINDISLSGNIDENDFIISQKDTTIALTNKYIFTMYYVGNLTGLVLVDEILIISGNGLDNTGTTILSFADVQINEFLNSFGNNCEISIGITYLNISGELVYYSGGIPSSNSNTSIPIPNSQISIVNSNNENNLYNASTDNSGYFLQESIVGNEMYDLIITKDEYQGFIANYYDGLSAVDASRIARHAVGLYEFTSKEKIAANVNFDYRCEDDDGNPYYGYSNENDCLNSGPFHWVPNIEAGDASKVALYAAGIIDNLDNECDPHWVFFNPDNELMLNPEDCTEDPYEIILNANISEIYFQGVRLGDVSGNWRTALSREKNTNSYDIPIVNVNSDEIINLPIYIPNNMNVEGIDLTIEFNSEDISLLDFTSINDNINSSSYTLLTNNINDGVFKFVTYAQSNPADISGLIGYISFKVISQRTITTMINISEMKVNEISNGGFLIEHGENVGNVSSQYQLNIISLPKVFELKQNYPNPFNPTTNVRFDLPTSGDVQISIYDIKGQLVDELVNGYLDAGYHQVKWTGNDVSSGIYFIRMVANNSAYKKILKVSLIK